jgi:GntR family transcriptional repressor for pyruvate dehydrogenase complex
MLRAGVFYNRKVMFKVHTTRSALLDQHRVIHDAIRDRDPARARSAVEAHLDYVEASMYEEKKAEENEGVAKLRYEHELGRQ